MPLEATKRIPLFTGLIKRNALIGSIMALVLVAAVACSQSVGDNSGIEVASTASTVSATQGSQSAVEAEPDTGQPVVISNSELSDDVIGDAPASIDQPAAAPLTADEIVAAFESVVSRVFSNSLPSVVEITVRTRGRARRPFRFEFLGGLCSGFGCAWMTRIPSSTTTCSWSAIQDCPWFDRPVEMVSIRDVASQPCGRSVSR